MKKLLLMLAVIAVGIGLYLVAIKPGGAPSPRITEPATDFVKIGTLTYDSPGQAQGVLYLVYEEPGAPALSQPLIMDALSSCATSSGATPCIAMSVTWDIPFAGRRAMVEGVKRENGVLVRKLYRLEEGEPELIIDPGSIFIAWPEAVSLIEGCQATSVMQTHKLDVYITLKNGQRVRAIQPVIDEIFGLTETAMQRCGSFPIATE